MLQRRQFVCFGILIRLSPALRGYKVAVEWTLGCSKWLAKGGRAILFPQPTVCFDGCLSEAARVQRVSKGVKIGKKIFWHTVECQVSQGPVMGIITGRATTFARIFLTGRGIKCSPQTRRGPIALRLLEAQLAPWPSPTGTRIREKHARQRPIANASGRERKQEASPRKKNKS